MWEMVEGGMESGSASSPGPLGLGSCGRLGKTLLYRFLLGVAVTWIPCANGFRVGFLGSVRI